eukprot:3249063-Amphidinium_carterae.1
MSRTWLSILPDTESGPLHSAVVLVGNGCSEEAVCCHGDKQWLSEYEALNVPELRVNAANTDPTTS